MHFHLLSEIAFVTGLKSGHLVCLRRTVHAKTRQGAGSEGMVHEHAERYRGRPSAGNEGAGRRDVRMPRTCDTNERSRNRQITARFPVFRFRKQWLRHTGSPQSRIDKAEFHNEKEISQPSFSNFEIRK